MLPKKLTRKTKHKNPRCQLYQPGFNPGNSCWLEGQWLTVPAEGFDKRAEEHEKLYQGLASLMSKQHYRDPGIDPANMTPAQRQAWEHFCGTRTYEIRYESGEVGGVSMELAADKPIERSLDWLRTHKAKVIPKVLQPNGLDENGKPNDPLIVDQTDGIPEDLLTDDAEPVDVWKIVVKQNQNRSSEMSRAMAEIAITDDPTGLAAGVAIQGLLDIEEGIIRMETRNGEDPYETLDELKERYRSLRSSLEGTFKDDFLKVYQSCRKTHNGCARTNLDNSNGFLACYVLPEFHSDGSHEPYGPRDVPWGRSD